MLNRYAALATALMASTGCAPVGDLAVTIYGEEFIEDGIDAAEFVDDWEVRFDAFEVNVENVDLSVEASEDVSALSTPTLFDLSEATDGAGQDVGTVTVAAETPLLLAYRIGPEADTGCAVFVDGTAERNGVTKRFSWCIPGETDYIACETTAVATPDSAAESQITIHADHLFYDDLVSSNPNVAFDLIAAADADDDDVISEAELSATDISGEARYQVGNANIDNLWDFITAQSRTVGHIDGEGHCEQG